MDGTVITFREGHNFNLVVEKVDASYRFDGLPSGDVFLDYVEDDSPIANLLLWDIAHLLAVGSVVASARKEGRESFLSRSYFRSAFVEESPSSFRKISMLPAEVQRGLDRWTFGIPVGPDDATLLNIVVKRILDLDIPEKEILLCGTPGTNFAYRNEVRIVGEDIPAPPVPISRKKNLLAAEASYENLCIIHDRVFLPSNFMVAVKAHGDMFPLQTFQSIYFDDKLNLLPRRYSDMGILKRDRSTLPKAQMPGDGRTDVGSHAPQLIAPAENYGYLQKHPLRHKPGHVYATGSLYVCKKAVWQFAPQDDNFMWAEMEDIEHGFRAEDVGIPTSMNTYSFTQSLSARPLLNYAGGTSAENSEGAETYFRLGLPFTLGRRKPLFRTSLKKANESFDAFSNKYNVKLQSDFTDSTTVADYITRYIICVKGALFPVNAIGADTFFVDVFRLLSFEQALWGWRKAFVTEAYYHGLAAREFLISGTGWLDNLASQRRVGPVFYEKLNEYLPPDTRTSRFGLRITAHLLSRRNGDLLYLKDGSAQSYERALAACTPWAEAT